MNLLFAELLPMATSLLIVAVFIGVALFVWTLPAEPGTRRRRQPIIGLIGLLLIVFLSFNFNMQKTPTTVEVVKLKNDWRLQPFQGSGRTSLLSYPGKVVFVNIWGTECPPCRAEMPSIQQLYDRLRDKSDVQFLMVSVDKDAESLQEFLRDEGYTFPVFMPAEAPPRGLADEGIPTTLILDKSGNVHTHHVGYADWSTPAVMQLIDKLRAADAPLAENR